MKNSLTFIILMILAGSCTPKTEAFNYGEDQCSFCKMSIVDEKYAAEAVTAKGKVYKYDDISCMIRHQRSLETQDYAFRIVNNFDQPSEFIDVEKAFFITSDQYASPMGGNTAAFKNPVNTPQDNYNWTQLQEIFD